MTTNAVLGIITKVKKRTGSIEEFQERKITTAISKALEATGKKDAHRLADELEGKVVKKLKQLGYDDKRIPMVEDVQDVVEQILIDSGLADTAKAYIVYRHEHRKMRDEKKKILQKQELDDVDKALDLNALKVLEARYLLRDGDNHLSEDPRQLFERVAVLMGIADILYDSRIFERNHAGGALIEYVKEAQEYLSKTDKFNGTFRIGKYIINNYHFEQLVNQYIRLAGNGDMKVSFKEFLTMLAKGEFVSQEERITEYFDLMVQRDFLPNTPTLMNAGAPLGQLSACFVLPVPDHLPGIMQTAMDAAMIFKSGGGVGFNWSDLRPMGDIVASTSGVASGPTTFMEIINTITNVIKQGGKRRGANMGILEVWHPDIEKFISMKTVPGVMENFNVSVGIWDDFWQALVKDEKYSLHNPRTNAQSKSINPQQLIDTIALSAWKSAEPGLIFFDNCNKYNPMITARNGPIRCSNPCGEQLLYPYESCNLGSINLANFVKRDADGHYEFDWVRYEQVIRTTTRFLDNVVDMNKYPIEQIDQESRATRRIGLGIMGIADVLFKLGLPYNSHEGYETMGKLAEALTFYSMEEGVILSMRRGAFPLFQQSDYVKGSIPVAGYYETTKSERNYDWDGLIDKIKKHGIRNSWSTTIAPTGTLSMIADCSNGVEPAFALVYEKRVTVGSFYYKNKVFESVLKSRGLFTDDIIQKIADNYGSVRGLGEIPKDIQDLFVTAMDVHWIDHVMAQAVWQRWISNAIAKTINMPGDVSSEDIKSAYLLSHELGLKGVTVYRDGSRQTQVLHITGENNGQKKFSVRPSKYVTDYVKTTIKEPYVLAGLEKVFKDTGMTKAEQHAPRQEPQEIPTTLLHTTPQRMIDDVIAAGGNGHGHICPNCTAPLINAAGCHSCIECGFSACSSD